MSDYLPGKLLMVDENENEIEVQGTISINEEPDLWSIDEKDPLRNTYITHNSLSIDIDGSMMLSRKKFIKLLMSKGIGRNGANEIAKHVLKKNGRYTMMDVLMW